MPTSELPATTVYGLPFETYDGRSKLKPARMQYRLPAAEVMWPAHARAMWPAVPMRSTQIITTIKLMSVFSRLWAKTAIFSQLRYKKPHKPWRNFESQRGFRRNLWLMNGGILLAVFADRKSVV